jgi:hypothetical protein
MESADEMQYVANYERKGEYWVHVSFAKQLVAPGKAHTRKHATNSQISLQDETFAVENETTAVAEPYKESIQDETAAAETRSNHHRSFYQKVVDGVHHVEKVVEHAGEKVLTTAAHELHEAGSHIHLPHLHLGAPHLHAPHAHTPHIHMPHLHAPHIHMPQFHTHHPQTLAHKNG